MLVVPQRSTRVGCAANEISTFCALFERRPHNFAKFVAQWRLRPSLSPVAPIFMPQSITSIIDALLGLPLWASVLTVCLLGLIIWLQRQRTRDLRRARAVSPNLMIAPLTSLSRQQFDMLLKQAFRQRGYVIGEIAIGQRSAQGAADLILRKSGEYFLVHSKAWRVALVEVTAIRELDQAMRAQRAAGGFVVTSGSFTREAMGFASGRKIQLIDGRTLREMLNDTAGMPTGVPTVVSLGPTTMSKQA